MSNEGGPRMFEKFFRKRFETDSGLEPIVQEYAKLGSESTMMSTDRDAFTAEEIAENIKRRDEIESKYGEDLRMYLTYYEKYINEKQPYSGREEWARWFAAKMLFKTK
ncbi:MAG: hypothetical protein V1711_02690 [bacterium]